MLLKIGLAITSPSHGISTKLMKLKSNNLEADNQHPLKLHMKMIIVIGENQKEVIKLILTKRNSTNKV